MSWLWHLRETFTVIALGVAIGVPAALAASRFVSRLLFGLAPTDPVTIVMGPWPCSRWSPLSPAISPRAAPRASIRSSRCATNSATHASHARNSLESGLRPLRQADSTRRLRRRVRIPACKFSWPVMGSVKQELRCAYSRVHANDRERSNKSGPFRASRVKRHAPRTTGGAWIRKGGPNAGASASAGDAAHR